MFNISFLTCTEVELWDLTVCNAVNEEIFQSRSELDLGRTIPNIELVRDTFIYNNMFKFYVHRSITFGVTIQKHTHKRTRMHTQDSDEYSIVAFCKNATIITQQPTQFVCEFGQHRPRGAKGISLLFVRYYITSETRLNKDILKWEFFSLNKSRIGVYICVKSCFQYDSDCVCVLSV